MTRDDNVQANREDKLSPSRRVMKTTTAKCKGLGLPTAYCIIKQHQGRKKQASMRG